MPERGPEFFLIDILIAVDKVRRGTSGLTLKKFLSSESAVDLTMRNLEIIGEAANQLLKSTHFLKGMDVEWRKIVDFRNIAIHFYFGVDFDLVFNEIVKNKILLLEKEILSFIKTKDNKSSFLQAIASAKTDLSKMYRDESIAYLEEIERSL